MVDTSNQGPERENAPIEGRRYTWPWLVLAAFVLGLVLAVLWMSKEIQRTKRIRDANPAATLDIFTGPRAAV